MSNTNQLIKKTIEAFMILGIIFVMGLFVPMLISLFVVIFTSATFESIISEGVVFWLFTVIGWFLSAFFVNDALKE